MRRYACTEEEFLEVVSRHEMTILRDDGESRHVRFKRPGEGAYWFDVITWPGTLCIDGDCGTYVFRRLPDMFEFFRADREYCERMGCKLAINPGYWSEKLQATSRHGHDEFDTERFREIVKERFDDWVEEKNPSAEAKDELWEDIESKVLWASHDDETRARDAAHSYRNEAHGFDLYDFWEHNLRSFTFHFIWCCYAIAWGVKTYDERLILAHSINTETDLESGRTA